MLLTAAEVASLTGETRPKAQIAWLRREGWMFIISGKGLPKVAREYAEERLNPPASEIVDYMMPPRKNNLPDRAPYQPTPEEIESRRQADIECQRLADIETQKLAEEWGRTRATMIAAHAAKRRAAKLQRTPRWVDYAEIQKVFTEARRLTRKTGILHSVDHIIPLQGKLVSGLHVPWNLRPIPAAENSRKHNKFCADVLNA